MAAPVSWSRVVSFSAKRVPWRALAVSILGTAGCASIAGVEDKSAPSDTGASGFSSAGTSGGGAAQAGKGGATGGGGAASGAGGKAAAGTGGFAGTGGAGAGGSAAGVAGTGGIAGAGGIAGTGGIAGAGGGTSGNAGTGGGAGLGGGAGIAGSGGSVSGSGGASGASAGASGAGGGATAGSAGASGSSGATGGTGGASSVCGNGIVEGAEDCDGSLPAGKTCQSVLGKPALGSLKCSAACTFDTSSCTYCGNGKRDGKNEACDAGDLAGLSCTVVAPGATGSLACSPYCQLDTSGCTPSLAEGDTAGLAPGAPWPMYGHGPTHSGRTLVKSAHTAKLTTTFNVGAPTTGGFSIGADGTAYLADENGVALDFVKAGALSAQLPLAATAAVPTLGADGNVYVPGQAQLFAVLPPSTIKWSASSGQVYGPPVIGGDGSIYFAAEDGLVYAVHPDGSPKWTYNAGPGGFQSSVRGIVIGLDGTVYTRSLDNVNTQCKTHALDPTTGVKKWIYPDAGCWGLAVGADGTVYAGDGAQVHALDPTTGSKVWSAPGHPGCIGADGTIYGAASAFHAVAANGTPRWSIPLDNFVAAGCAIDGDGVVFFNTFASTVVAALPTGETLWTVKLSPTAASSSPPAIGADGTLYATDWDGNVYLFGP